MAAIYSGSGLAWHSCKDAVGCSKSATSCTADATEVACVLLCPSCKVAGCADTQRHAHSMGVKHQDNRLDGRVTCSIAGRLPH